MVLARRTKRHNLTHCSVLAALRCCFFARPANLRSGDFKARLYPLVLSAVKVSFFYTYRSR